MGTPPNKSKKTTAVKTDEVKSINNKFAEEVSQRKEFETCSY